VYFIVDIFVLAAVHLGMRREKTAKMYITKIITTCQILIVYFAAAPTRKQPVTLRNSKFCRSVYLCVAHHFEINTH